MSARSSSNSNVPNVGTSISPIRVVFISFLILPFVANFSWLRFILTAPRQEFPAHYVRSFGHEDEAQTTCIDLDQTSSNGATIAFCEDAEILHGDGLDGFALFSCDPGRGKWNTVMGPLIESKPRGALWIFPYEQAVRKGLDAASPIVPVLLPLEGLPTTHDFHPLGTESFPPSKNAFGEDIPGRIFVVNHQGFRSTIDIFALYTGVEPSEWKAVYLGSISHPLVTHTPNSVVALSSNELLITQDHFFALRPAPLQQLQRTYSAFFPDLLAGWIASIASIKILSFLLPKIETLLGLPFGFVTYVKFEELASPSQDLENGLEVKIVSRGIPFANGIAMSPNRKIVAVASTTTPGVLLFNLDHQSNHPPVLQPKAKIHTPNLADNIAFSKPRAAFKEEEDDEFGVGAKLLAGGTANGLQLMAFAKDPDNYAKRAPSWVISIEPQSKRPAESDEEAPYSLEKRLLARNEDYLLKTVYQGRGPIKVDEKGLQIKNEEEGRWIGIASATNGAWDPEIGKGTLLVPGLYSKPGVMVCSGVGL